MPRTVGVALTHAGVDHQAQGLLTYHNLTDAAGENVKQKEKNSDKNVVSCYGTGLAGLSMR